MKSAPLRLLLVLIAAGLACTTSPLGRRQLKLFSPDEMDAMGIAAFDRLEDAIHSLLNIGRLGIVQGPQQLQIRGSEKQSAGDKLAGV